MFRYMMKTFLLVAALLVGFATGCGTAADDADDETNQENKRQAGFALATTVLGQDSNTTFVRYLEELDVGKVELENARSYPGNATIGSVGGMFFVGSGESPKVTRFNVGEDGTLEKNGQISFSQYVDKAPLFANMFVDETSAYLDKEESSRVIWNPKEMTIERKDRLDPIEKKVDKKPVSQGSRRGMVVRGDVAFQSFYWAGPDFYEYAPNSKILVYDTETDEIKNVIEAPCPGLGVGTEDEEGNVYFTNWVGPSAAPVIEGESEAPSPCAVRIDAGETTLNEDWTRDLTEMTDGRQVTAMRMLEGSTAIAAVLDEEKVDADSETDPQKITYANNWELWRLDLEEGTGSKVPGIGHIAGGYYAFRLDGRMVVTLPDADYGSTTGYEVSVDGEATKLFDANGWVYQMVEIE